MPGSPRFVTARLCATCDLHWPYHPDYVQCPQCGFNTILRSTKSESVMTPEAAKRYLANIKFERFLNEETESARRIRESRARTQEQDQTSERAKVSREINQRFDEVIAGGGFTKHEQEMYRALERALRT